MPEPSPKDGFMRLPKSGGRGRGKAKSGQSEKSHLKYRYSSSKLVAQDTTLLRNSIAPVL